MDEIKRLESKALSSYDIIGALNGKTNLMSYQQLHLFDNIDDVLGIYGACVLLYLTKNNYGHWTCLFKTDTDKISVFDSYGLIVDDELDFVPVEKREKLGESFRYLTYLLYNSPYEIEYNNYKFQEYSSGEDRINTCGRFVIVRLWNRNLDPEEFKDMIYHNPFNLSPDEYVTFLTKNI